jgi:hypothetical protein
MKKIIAGVGLFVQSFMMNDDDIKLDRFGFLDVSEK